MLSIGKTFLPAISRRAGVWRPVCRAFIGSRCCGPVISISLIQGRSMGVVARLVSEPKEKLLPI